jgi:hypothetical protein
VIVEIDLDSEEAIEVIDVVVLVAEVIDVVVSVEEVVVAVDQVSLYFVFFFFI